MRGRPPTAVARLVKRAQFVAAARGRRINSERLTVQALSRAPDGAEVAGLRVGLTLTKKVGHATERNRIRRRLRSAVAEAAWPFAAASLDIVVVGRREALSAPYGSLVDDLARALSVVARPGAASGSRTRASGQPRSRT